MTDTKSTQQTITLGELKPYRVWVRTGSIIKMASLDVIDSLHFVPMVERADEPGCYESVYGQSGAYNSVQAFCD